MTWPGVSMLCMYMLSVCLLWRLLLLTPPPLQKFLQCCQITNCFNCTKHSIDFNEKRSCLKRGILATHRLNLLSELSVFVRGIYSKLISNRKCWTKLTKSVNFGYNGHIRTPHHIMTASTSHIRQRTESFAPTRKPLKMPGICLMKETVFRYPESLASWLLIEYSRTFNVAIQSNSSVP
jgi:hypothetical protein